MTREENLTHEGFVYANNIYLERKCELLKLKDISHDFVQGAIYADQHPRKGLWDAEKVVKWILENADEYVWYDEMENECGITDDFIKDLQKAMEE